MLLLASAAWACTWYVYDDYADGSTDGRQYGGTFVPGGWRPDGGSIVYDLPEVGSGNITFRITNVDESGVSQHDLLELFSGEDGSFSDHRRDNFLQVKFAGDIYDGYDGRVKLQAGPEWYGDVEVGAWTSEFNWDPGTAYDVAVSFGGTTASMDIGGVLSTGIDYGYYGELSFRTLRIPNDGGYARDGLMDDIVIAGVSLCGDPPVGSGGDTGDGGGGGGDTGTPTDTGDGGGGGDTGTPEGDSGGGGGQGDGATEPPTVLAFGVDPAEVDPGEPWQVSWAVSGELWRARFCFRASSATFESCAALSGASGTASFPTTGVASGEYVAWLDASGPGGEAASLPTTLVVRSVAPASGCAAAGTGPGATAILVGLVLGLRRRPRF